MHKHLIIGLGWLGSPLGLYFKSAGHTVAGTTRNAEKAESLTNQGIQTVLFDLYENDAIDLPHELFKNAYVVINIPPGRKNFEPILFIERMKRLFDYAHQHAAVHICFISTTSVFGELEGRVAHNSPFAPNTASGNAHVELERYLKELASAYDVTLNPNLRTNGFSCSVLRLAGLVGNDRHPISTLSQKSNIAMGKNPVNLVHQEDVIRVISAVLQNSGEKGSLNEAEMTTSSPFENNFFAANLCSLEHPSREQYYTWCAEQKGIRVPQFSPDNRARVNGKWIDAEHTINKLGLKLRYPSPYDMLG
jgi:nucleoside-diphosphate-sugar epimerase